MTLNKPKYNLIIILGGGISETGELPIWVHSRLDKSLELYDKVGKKLLMSGKGKPDLLSKLTDITGKDDLPITEAGAMKKYLVSNNIPQQDIFTECFSEDTIQNAYFSKKSHIDPHGIKSFLVITSKFHLARTEHIFNWVFGDEYQITFTSASDEGIEKKDLITREAIEAKLLHFHEKKIFPSIKPGDIQKIHSFIFNPEGKLAKAYKAFAEEVVEEQALY